MLWMILSCIAIAGLWVLVRLVSTEMHPFNIVVWRNAMGLMWLVPMLITTRGLLTPDRLTPNMIRAAWSLVATFATFYAISRAPLANALAITYTAPLFATLAAMLFFGEKVGRTRTTVLLVGFAGVLLVLRPGAVPITVGIFAAILAALSTAGSMLTIKQLAAIDDPRAIAAWSFLLMLPVSVIIALPVWEWPEPHMWSLLIGIGACAAAGQLAMTNALALADVSSILPFDFVRFALVTLAGIAMFGERYDLFTLLGGTIIVASTIALAIRERQRRGK